MAVTDVLRPISTRKSGAATAVPSGTLHSVTSDDSDVTYVSFPLASYGDQWNLRVAPHTPAAGYERHRVRGRARLSCDAGTMREDIDLGRGTSDYLTYKTVDVTTVFTEQVTDWSSIAKYGLNTVGALEDLNIGGGWPREYPDGTELRTAELYVDIDCRYRPDFTPEVRDNAGVDQSGGTITNTTQPTLFFGVVAYDDLPPLNWSVQLLDALDDEIMFSSGSGTPPAAVPVTEVLEDGSYTAVFTVRSTIRGADPFEYSVTVTFDVLNTVPPPSPPLVSVEAQYGGYRVEWTNPGGQTWDNDYVVAEVWREDCTGDQRIAVIADGLNGSYLDLAIPQLDPQPVQVDGDCEVSTPECDITYRVRYFGYIGILVDLPDSIPSGMILGWPSTAASIPSGWTRVTALDGYYPRGSSGTSAPTATGGATTHSHTTGGHAHSIGSHSHSLGGSTGSSNSSTTSARFNGASQPQADQPHTHSRPSSTGTRSGQNSGSSSPSTSSANNLPATREVIWIQSGGSAPGYPVGALGWATEAVSGWTDDSTSSGRFLKGATAGGNGGATSGAATHTHSVNSHSHTGFSHDHSIGNTGLSNPSSSQEAGYGSSSPRWLPRHTHPMDVVSASTGNSTSNGGGTTSSVNLEPPHRRLRVMRNTGGGKQTRIIGLHLSAVASISPLLTVCNGGSGTPDMRGRFCRDNGSDSVNSTGGSSSHAHTTPNHTHDIGSHSHDTNVSTSNTGSFEAPSFGDLGDSPTTSHTHSSGSTSGASPNVSSHNSGNTGTASHLPPYHDVHFVRLDGTIDADPLTIPELKITEFSEATVPSFTYDDGLDRLSSFTDRMAVVTDHSHAFPRLVADTVPMEGGLPTVSTTISGEDITLTIAVEGVPAIARLETMLRNERVYWSPVGGTPGWFAPEGWSVRAPAPDVKVVQVRMVRQPWPVTVEPEEFL